MGDKLVSYVNYDLETTGLDPRYDPPVRFGAIRMDDDLNGDSCGRRQ